MAAVSYKDPQLVALAADAERRYGLPKGILDALRTQGEASNSDQVSPKGALGVYQFMPATWNSFAAKGALRSDSMAATEAAAKYLQYALGQYGGSVGAALAEYNGGPRAAKKYLASGDPGNKETRDYLKLVLPHVTGEMHSDAPAMPSDEMPVLENPPMLEEPIEDSSLFGQEYSTGVSPRQPESAPQLFGASSDLAADSYSYDPYAQDTLDANIERIVNSVMDS